ncbi:MAG: ABC transporter C-terminal domain-containing protein, partial [Phycisphaerales bacterium]
ARQIVVLGAPGGEVSVVASLDQALAALERAEQASARAMREATSATSATSAPAATVASAPPAVRRRLGFKEQRELDGLEAAIEAAERACAAAEAAVADPAVAADHARMATACRTLESAQASVAALYARWQELESRRG